MKLKMITHFDVLYICEYKSMSQKLRKSAKKNGAFSLHLENARLVYLSCSRIEYGLKVVKQNL